MIKEHKIVKKYDEEEKILQIFLLLQENLSADARGHLKFSIIKD